MMEKAARRITQFTILVLAMLATPLPASANDSTYTDLDLDRCETLAADDMGASLKCRGFKSYPVYFKEGDLRQSVFYGYADQQLIDGGFESFAPFNRVHTKIEWRLDATGKPFAAIHRWFLENPGPDGSPTDESTGQVLVVSRVASKGDGAACFVALVDALANPDANALAREAADELAPSFACGMEEPMWIGKRGDKASDRTFSWPEGYVVE
ncbi:hypothetical protein [Ciceribacter sp. L1K23]|uniref:hypothetical protein n=1 Tax=Ciceribacter sp. L1K23 TaxID=2820276 RepID=UPI00201386CE|nr:hypothetical protein [Ciceribacter sp. L1K23]